MNVEELKKLIDEMKDNEINKLEIINQYYKDKKAYGNRRANMFFIYNILGADKKGYDLGIKFIKLRCELLKSEQITIEEYMQFKNPSLVSAQNLLYKYNLYFEECYRFNMETIEYSSLFEVDNNYLNMVSSIAKLSKEKNLAKFEEERLNLCAKYFYDISKIIVNMNNKNDLGMSLNK